MAKYHPLYSGVWDDPSLEGTSFATKAFFVFLFSNHRVRPSGVYRVSVDQLAADTRLPVAEVKAHLSALMARRRIVYVDEWLFVRGYLKRQPNSEFLLKGARADILACRSEKIKRAFFKQYPATTVWVTVGRRSPDGRQTVARPSPDGQVDGHPSEQLQLQRLSEGSGLEAILAQGRRQLFRKTRVGDDLLSARLLRVTAQALEIGVIGKRKGGVGAMPALAGQIDRPTGENHHRAWV